LTPREQEVIQLVWKGLTATSIAAKLNIAERTAEKHRENIKQKLGGVTIVNMLRIALKKGYITA
jgi:DNA-binding NarL/FixJ family response regulator